jgi:hypothetical protein
MRIVNPLIKRLKLQEVVLEAGATLAQGPMAFNECFAYINPCGLSPRKACSFAGTEHID